LVFSLHFEKICCIIEENRQGGTFMHDITDGKLQIAHLVRVEEVRLSQTRSTEKKRPVDSFAFLLSGRMEYHMYDGRAYTLRAGDIHFLPLHCGYTLTIPPEGAHYIVCDFVCTSPAPRRGTYFTAQNPQIYEKLFRELNRHRFILELDWAGDRECLFNQVENTQVFKKYIQTAFTDSQKKGGSDLQILCRDICGANLSVGWQNCHTPREKLMVSHWESNYAALEAFLEKPQPQFKIPLHVRLRRDIRALTGRILRKLGLRK
jgi:hypothetical protein